MGLSVLTGLAFLVLLAAVVIGVNMIHKAVSAVRDDLAQTRRELLQEIEKRR